MGVSLGIIWGKWVHEAHWLWPDMGSSKAGWRR